jgi:S-adenosylmethionine uptake transporter
MTLNYTSPVFLALLMAVLTREPPGLKLVASVTVGFVGAVLLLRPVFAGSQLLPGLVGLGSGAIAAVAYWNVRALMQADEPASRVVFYFALFSAGCAWLWMLPHPWTPVTAANVGVLAGVGIMGTLGQITLTLAYGNGSPLAAAALSYSSIVFSSVLAIALFGEALPWIAWAGIVLIVLAGIMAIGPAPTRPAPPPQITND